MSDVIKEVNKMNDIMMENELPNKCTMTSNVLNHMDTALELSLELEELTNEATRIFFGNVPKEEENIARTENNDLGFESKMNLFIDVLYHRIKEAIALLKKL